MSQLVHIALNNVTLKVVFFLNLNGQVTNSIFTEKVGN